MTMENKKAASGEVKQRIMLLYPCDVCRKRCTSSSYSRCPAFKSWAKTSWYWISRRIKKSAADGTTSATAQTK